MPIWSMLWCRSQPKMQMSYQLCMMLKGGGKPKTRNLSSYYTIISCPKHQKKVLTIILFLSWAFWFQVSNLNRNHCWLRLQGMNITEIAKSTSIRFRIRYWWEASTLSACWFVLSLCSPGLPSHKKKTFRCKIKKHTATKQWQRTWCLAIMQTIFKVYKNKSYLPNNFFQS